MPDRIALFCSLWISSILHDKHSIFLTFRNSDYIFNNGVLRIPLVKRLHVKMH